MADIPIISFDMTLSKTLNGSNSSKNQVHPSLILVYPILLARLDHFAPIKEISTCDLIQGGERGELEIGWWKDFLLSLI